MQNTAITTQEVILKSERQDEPCYENTPLRCTSPENNSTPEKMKTPVKNPKAWIISSFLDIQWELLVSRIRLNEFTLT